MIYLILLAFSLGLILGYKLRSLTSNIKQKIYNMVKDDVEGKKEEKVRSVSAPLSQTDPYKQSSANNSTDVVEPSQPPAVNSNRLVGQTKSNNLDRLAEEARIREEQREIEKNELGCYVPEEEYNSSKGNVSVEEDEMLNLLKEQEEQTNSYDRIMEEERAKRNSDVFSEMLDNTFTIEDMMFVYNFLKKMEEMISSKGFINKEKHKEVASQVGLVLNKMEGTEPYGWMSQMIKNQKLVSDLMSEFMSDLE